MSQPDIRTIKPAAGRKVRHPASGPNRGQVLAAEGEAVTWGSYWQRRLNDQDVEIVPTPRPAPAPPSPPSPPALAVPPAATAKDA